MDWFGWLQSFKFQCFRRILFMIWGEKCYFMKHKRQQNLLQSVPKGHWFWSRWGTGWGEMGQRVGLQWSGSGLGSQSETEAGSQLWVHQILATSPVVSDKGPSPSALLKRISAKIKSSEASRIFIKRTKSTLHVDRHMGGLRARAAEVHQNCSLNYFYKALLPGFLWPIILICLIHSSYLVNLRILPCVHMHLLARLDFTEKMCR